MLYPSLPCFGQAYLDAEHGMPLGGLALPLAEAPRHGILDALYLDALRQVDVRPSVSLGIACELPADGGHPVILGRVFETFLEGELAGAPDPKLPPFRALRTLTQLVPILPIIDLPATGDFWVYEAHFLEILRLIARGDISVEGLPPEEPWSHPACGPLPFVPPRAVGPVRPHHLAWFFAAFPDLGKRLERELPWSGDWARRRLSPSVANGAVRKLLGIELDLRLGCLITPGEVSLAIDHAAGTVELREGGSLYDRLHGFVDRLVPRVAPGPGVGRVLRGLSGAAWSCSVDAALNGPEAWTEGPDGRYLWADDMRLRRHRARRAVA